MATDKNGLEYKYKKLAQYDGYDIEQTPIRLLEPIGALLVTFSELEFTLDKAISFLFSDRSDSVGLYALISLAYSQKVKLYSYMCKAYLHDMQPDKKLQLKELAKRLISAGEVRNIVAHAKWMSVDSEGFVRAGTYVDRGAGHIKFKLYRLTPDVLEEHRERTVQLDEDLFVFQDSIESMQPL